MQREAESSIKNVARKAEDGAKKAIDEIEDGAKDAVREVEDGALKAIHEAEEAFTEKLPNLVEEAVTEKLPDLIEDAAQKLANEAAKGAIKEALDNAADVIEMMAPTSFTLIFGIELSLIIQGEVTVSVSLPNPAAKLTEIRRWADKPPNGRSQIIACIQDFAPESLAVEAKVSGNGLAAEWSSDDKFARLDAFLEKHGVG